MNNNNSEKKKSRGCTIAFIVGLFVLWGVYGVIDGKGFFESIGDNIEAALLIIGALFVLMMIVSKDFRDSIF